MNNLIEPQYNSNIDADRSQDRFSPRDMTIDYNSIIKDLTDTKEMLDNYELNLRGKKKDVSGAIINDVSGSIRMQTDRAARDFVDLIRSLVNRHNDFSYYDDKDSVALLNHANYTICRWLMLQGEEVPTRYRFKISTEAMNMIFSSTHKAIGGKMLLWTKGAFSEGMQHAPNQNKKSLLDYIIPGRKHNKYQGG